MSSVCLLFFFFNDTATTEIYTLSLHDALPILDLVRSPTSGVEDDGRRRRKALGVPRTGTESAASRGRESGDRKSTRLNSSHGYISYAVFCLKKKNMFFL